MGSGALESAGETCLTDVASVAREHVSDDRALQAAFHASRSLLWVEEPTDAVRAAQQLVAELGGQVVEARAADVEAIPIDVSFGEGAPRLPCAPMGSPARALLERYLPGFVRDAHRALELVNRSARLAEDAAFDPLTRLYNRRFIGRLLGRLRRDDTVVIIDLDHFKSVNDTHGHAAGDEVLRAFGTALRKTARAADRAGRYGGEEFVVVLASTEPEPFLRRLREEWEAVRPGPVTFSAGYARGGIAPTQAVLAADNALYRAKSLGRNRWEPAAEEDLL